MGLSNLAASPGSVQLGPWTLAKGEKCYETVVPLDQIPDAIEQLKAEGHTDFHSSEVVKAPNNVLSSGGQQLVAHVWNVYLNPDKPWRSGNQVVCAERLACSFGSEGTVKGSSTASCTTALEADAQQASDTMAAAVGDTAAACTATPAEPTAATAAAGPTQGGKQQRKPPRPKQEHERSQAHHKEQQQEAAAARSNSRRQQL
jgi:hypothetical protein